MDLHATGLFRSFTVLTLSAILLALLSCGSKPMTEGASNPVVVTIASGTRQTVYRLKEFELFTKLNYPEIQGPMDAEISSTIFQSFKRDLTLATIGQAYGIRILAPEMERFSKEYLHPLGYATMEQEERDLLLAEAKRRMTIRELLQRKIIKNEAVTDEQIAAYYEQNEAFFKKDSLYRIRFVQTGSIEKGTELRQRLKEGKETFKNVAADFAENDGHLFAIAMHLDELSEPFAKVVAKLTPGQYSNVITLQQKSKQEQHHPTNVNADDTADTSTHQQKGLEQYYVVNLDSTISAVQISFEDAYHYIGQELQRRYCRESLNKMLEDFEQSARFTLQVHAENLPFKYTDAPKEKEV